MCVFRPANRTANRLNKIWPKTTAQLNGSARHVHCLSKYLIVVAKSKWIGNCSRSLDNNCAAAGENYDFAMDFDIFAAVPAKPSQMCALHRKADEKNKCHTFCRKQTQAIKIKNKINKWQWVCNSGRITQIAAHPCLFFSILWIFQSIRIHFVCRFFSLLLCGKLVPVHCSTGNFGMSCTAPKRTRARPWL